MNVIEVKDLKKIYNSSEVKVNALNGIDLTIEQGEFTAIVGPSGSGKTTFLNMLGGLDMPTSGEISIGGTDIRQLVIFGTDRFQVEEYRLCFSGLQPHSGADGNGKCGIHHANAGSQQKRTRTTGQRIARPGGAWRPDQQPSVKTFGRAAATGCSGAGIGFETQICAGRRTHRQPRFKIDSQLARHDGRAQ